MHLGASEGLRLWSSARDEWLVHVATDDVGKATIIAAALTLIERSLLPGLAVPLYHRRAARQLQRP